MAYKIMFLLIIFLNAAMADYSPVSIKEKITAMEASFEVKEWRRNEADNGWLAKTGLKNTVLFVGDLSSGFIVAVPDSTEALMSILRCVALGEAALNPATEEQRQKLINVVTNVGSNPEGTKIAFNQVELAVSLHEAEGNVLMSCSANPVVTSKQGNLGQ